MKNSFFKLGLICLTILSSKSVIAQQEETIGQIVSSNSALFTTLNQQVGISQFLLPSCKGYTLTEIGIKTHSSSTSGTIKFGIYSSDSPHTLVYESPAINVAAGANYVSQSLPSGLLNYNSYQDVLMAVLPSSNTIAFERSTQTTDFTGTGSASNVYFSLSATYPTFTEPYNSLGTPSFGCLAFTLKGIPVAANLFTQESSGSTNNDGIICSGASTTISASGGASYLWSTGATTATITPTPNVTTTYTVTLTATNGCSNTGTKTITVNNSPSASINTVESSGTTNNDGTICNGASTTLTATGGTSYTWSTGATTASISPSPNSTTTYTVTVINSESCSASSNQTLTVFSNPMPAIMISETSGVLSNDGTICQGTSVTLTAIEGGSYTWSTGETGDIITPSPGSSTTYTVTATNTGGCSGTEEVSITVNVAPTASIAVTETSGTTNNDGTICDGISATLTATSGFSYSWSTGETTASISPSPNATTAYTVTVTNSESCTASESQTLTVNELPDVSVQTNNFTITANLSGANYQWVNCATEQPIAGANNQSFTATTNGTYGVVVSQNGCSDVSECEEFSTIGLNEIEANSVVLFPNPTNDNITISSTDLIEKITITNTLGQIISTLSINEKQTKVDLSNYTNGLYLFTLQTNTGSTTKTIVKN